MNVFLPVDVVALLVLWWSAGFGMHGGHEVNTWRALLFTVSLTSIHVFSLVGIFSLIGDPRPIDWYARGVLWGCAGAAGWLYDYRFGIGRHWRMAIDSLLHRSTGAR